MKKYLYLLLCLFCFISLYSQGIIKSQYKSVLLLNDSNIYVIKETPSIKNIEFGGKEIAYHAFFNGSNILHATFLKKDDYFIFEEYNMAGQTIAKGKLIQDVLYCKKDTQIILSPITLREIEKHITCFYQLIKISRWEYMDENLNKMIGNYFNGKKDGIWNSYVNTDYLNNIKIYKMDNLVKDSNIHHISNYAPDSLNNIINGTWYATPINKNTKTMILKRDVKDFTFDYSINLSSNNLFERNTKFIIENDPNNKLNGQWKWNSDNTMTLTTNNQKIILQFLYIDKNEIIIKEINQLKI